MKCSVCAQDIPEDRYSEHLESEHGVTDDPTAVLIQHLTGLHSAAAEGDGDEGLPDEEPSDADADAFEEFLAAHPTESEGGQDEAEQEEPEEEQEEQEEPAPAAEAASASAAPVESEEAEEEEPEDEEPKDAADSAEGEGEELTDDDEAEFERMLATYPEVDLRKGGPAATPAGTDAGADDTEALPAVAAGPTAVATAAATADHDDKTFAVWDEARGAPPEDEDVPLVVPPAEVEKQRRRRQAALLGLGACIILVAIAVIYLLTRDTSSKTNTTATSPTLGTVTTVSPTFLPGPANGEPTTVGTQPPVTQAPTTAPPATTATPATPATTAPTTDPGSKIVFSYSGATCTASGSLSVFGTITNTNSATYTFSYQIVLLRSDGTQQGTANGQVTHLPPGGRFGPGTIGTGTCTYPLVAGPSPRQQITAISPG